MAAKNNGPAKCRRKFLRFFPKGFHDDKYVDWERGYKWEAHERWQEMLGQEQLRKLVSDGEHAEVARRAVNIESRTNLLFSFEKMALRDAVKSAAAVAMAVRTGTPQNIMNGMLRKAPPADTRPEMAPMVTPTANNGPAAGKLREAGGLRPSSIWVAPA